jgi:NADPH:quinone reductase-like Zn-dependent oxidoreductase
MRAAVLHEVGSAPTYDEVAKPVEAEGESLVRVTAAPVVPLDLLCASGTSYFGRPALPYVPGVQGVGVVERSPTLAPGTRVWFATSAGMAPDDGSLAEHCAVPEDDLVALEAAVPDALVAALGLSAVAAWMALTWRGRLQPGERVLVLGAGGAVGQAAVGAARALGAGRVTAVCRSTEAQERARAAGAHAVVALAGDVDDLTAALTEATGGAVDVVVDPVFGIAATAASRVLAPGGRLVNLGGASQDQATFSSAVLRSRSVDVLGYTNNSLTVGQRRDAFTSVLELAAQGLVSVAHTTERLSDVGDAWGRVASGAVSSRVVLVP